MPYDEKATFGDLWSDHAPLTELSSRWRFRADGANLGLGKGWSAPEFDDSGWFLIDSGLPWDEQGYRAYDGYGWYRQTLRAPALPAGKKIYLAFGAVAHGAEVYVNGHLAGQHNMDGWAYAFGDPWEEAIPHRRHGASRGGAGQHDRRSRRRLRPLGAEESGSL